MGDVEFGWTGTIIDGGGDFVFGFLQNLFLFSRTVKMVEPIGGEAGDGPAVLRLRKWDQSQFQLNLSEFREAVISPTREVLVLLSYQSEALLLPLIAGKFSQLLPDLS